MTLEKIPNISVDCVVFGFDVISKSLNVLLINRRLNKPNKENIIIDDYVLTGYHIYKNETLDDAASRVLNELTGLHNLYKKQFKVFGNPNRLMNKKDIIWAESENFNLRTVTVAYYFLLPTHEVNLEENPYNANWFPINNLPELGFDHEKIINEAYEDLKFKSLHEPITFELLPDKFTIKDLQDLYESILGIQIDNRNFRRKLIKKKYIIALDEKQTGVSKKPAQLYMFSRDVYKKVYEKNFLINI
ncbi:NUDIX domain-containing protein [uncultured Polaribacter sp.]|uniref:NUDIX hydrolase n=1 Tax=uncultured Polaribacter sp. TaxID=174711 RepID=UPI0026197D42|nr:NUDIX domain-containing protein [uncultured Polaribacter sp.]